MNFTGIDFAALMPDNSLAYIAFDLEYGFRLLEERRDLNAVYFRDLADADPDGVSNTAVTNQGLIIKSSLVAYNGSLAPLEDRVGKLIKIGDTWATVLLYNSNKSVVVDNYPLKLPPIQSIQNNLINVPLHGLTDNTQIQFSGATPIGITEGTTYYVRNPTTNSFNVSATSGGANITLIERAGELHVSKLYSVYAPTLDYDVIKDTIIGKVIRTGNVYTVETFYNVSGESITSFEIVEALPTLGAYEGQVVLFQNTFYTWNGVSWATASGTSSRTVSLSTTRQAFDYTSNGNIVGGSQQGIVTATAFGTTGTLIYEFRRDGTLLSGTGNTRTYTPNPSFDAMPDIVTVDLFEDGLLVASDLITMFGVIEGGDAITIVLSNEAHTIPTNSSGGSPDVTGSGTTVKVFRGNTPLTYISGGTTSSFDVSVTNGSTISGPTTVNGTGTTTATISDVTNISADTGFRNITITVYFDGATLPFSKVQSFSRSKAGVNGENVVVSTGPTAPSNPSTGDIWYNGSVAFYYNGTVWVQIINAPSGTRTLTSLAVAGIYTGEIAQFGGSYYLWNGTAWLLAIDGAVLVLSNQSHTLPATSAGVPTTYAGADTRVFVYESGIDNTSTWTLSAGISNVTGGFGSGANSNLYTVTNLSQPSGYVDITASKTGRPSKTSRFSLSTSSAGTNGVAVRLRPSVPVIKESNTGGRFPTTLTFKAENVSASGVTTYTGDINITSGTDGVNFPTSHGTASNVSQSSITVTSFPGSTFFRGILYAPGTLNTVDEQIVAVVKDGADGNTQGTVSRLDLSNESHAIPASFNGTVLSFAGADTDLRVYKGQNLDTGWTFSEVAEVNVTGSFPGGTSSSTANPAVYTVASWSGTADAGYVDFQATKAGEATLFGTFSLSRIRGGADGSSPTVYALVLSADAVVRSPTGAFTPSVVNFSATSTTGNALPVSFAGTIKYQLDTGSGFGSEITANSYTLTGNVISIKVNLYNGATLVDSETIPVIAGGARGAGRWHIPVTSLPTTSALAQTAWDTAWTNRPGVQIAADQAWFYTGTINLPTGQSVWIYNGTSWVQQTEVIDGNLLVTETITADKLDVNTLSAITADLGTVTAGSLAVGLITGDVTKTTPFRNLTPVVFNNGETTLFEIDLPASTHPQGHKPFSIVTGWMDGTDTRTYRFNMYMKSNTGTSTLLGTPTSAYSTNDGKGNTFYYITYNGVISGGDTLTAPGKSHIYVSSSLLNGVTTIQYALSSGVAFTTSDSITVNTGTNYTKVGESRFRPFGNARSSFSVSGSLGTFLTGTITMKLTVHRFDNTDTNATTSGANDDIRETSGILMGIR